MAERVSTNLDPERLRYMTRFFLSRKTGGLTFAAFGAFLFALETTDILPGRFTGSLLLLLSVGLWLIAQSHVPKYYERRFGWVEGPESSQINLRGFVILMLALLVLMLIGPGIGGRLDAFFLQVGSALHGLMSDPENRVHLSPILMCWILLLTAGPKWRGRNDSLPLIGIAILWSAVFLYPLHQPEIVQTLSWRIVDAGWLGMSLMALGVYDHITFIRLLPKRKQEEDI